MTMSEPTVVLGIDNGISGGLTAIAVSNGDILLREPMPVTEVSGKSEPCVRGLLRLLDELNRERLVIAIEEPLRHAKSSPAIRSMALCFGKIVGMAETKGIAVERIAVRDWQKSMLGVVPAKMTKVFALRAANKLWPDEQWLATKRSRVAHDGLVDAALIAEFHRRTL